MKKTYLIATTALMLLITMCAFAPAFEGEGDLVEGPEICGFNDYMAINNGEYYLWNHNYGDHCIMSNGGTDWTVISNTSGNAYPCIFKGCHWGTWCTNNSGMPIQISNIGSASSSWTISGTDAPGNWNAAYDVWISKNGGTAPDAVELMIWFAWAGTHRPAGSIVADNISISGVTWELWETPFDMWDYIAYRAKNQITSANIDIKAFIQDLINRGYCQSSWWVDAIEAGFEIGGNSGDGVGLNCSSFSASVSTGGATTSTTTTAASTSTTTTSATTSTTSATTTTTSGGGCDCGTCDWYGTDIPMCCESCSGWGWYDGGCRRSCVCPSSCEGGCVGDQCGSTTTTAATTSTTTTSATTSTTTTAATTSTTTTAATTSTSTTAATTTTTAATTTTTSGGGCDCGTCSWWGTNIPMCCESCSGWGWYDGGCQRSCVCEGSCPNN